MSGVCVSAALWWCCAGRDRLLSQWSKITCQDTLRSLKRHSSCCLGAADAQSEQVYNPAFSYCLKIKLSSGGLSPRFQVSGIMLKVMCLSPAVTTETHREVKQCNGSSSDFKLLLTFYFSLSAGVETLKVFTERVQGGHTK